MEEKVFYNNELLIKKCISDHLKVQDKKQQENMEKLFIYNLLN